jgi:hypothetical protein
MSAANAHIAQAEPVMFSLLQLRKCAVTIENYVAA